MPVNNSYKYLMNSKLGTVTTLNNQKLIYFGGAGYYLLQSHPEVINAAVRATLKYGIGSASSRTLTGTTELIMKLENSIAGFFGSQDSVYLPSGYLTNIAGFQALNELNLYDIIFIDEYAHYCNVDGALISGKKVVKFSHRDINDLSEKIKNNCKKGERPLIASDGVFPIKAITAPVGEYLRIAEKYKGIVWIDDSHGVGVLGENGRGTYEHHQLKSESLYMGATLSKAFGAYGGFIVGNTEFIKQVKKGNVITGSSAPPNAMVAAAIKGIELLDQNPVWRKNLWENALFLKKGLNEIGIITSPDTIPIATFNWENPQRMEKIQTELTDAGIFIQYLNYIGSGNHGALRMVVNAFHSKSEIDHLIKNLSQLIFEQKKAG
jgi:7-keto-8-aminopelargonate synthetase-like enzyme